MSISQNSVSQSDESTTSIPLSWKRIDGFNKVRGYQLASGEKVDLSLKYSLHYQPGSKATAWSKPITVVKPALTAKSEMFACHTKEFGEEQLGKGWGNHLLGSPLFDLTQTSILVVESVAGNSSSNDVEFPCSGEELFDKYGTLDLHQSDTVGMVNLLLKDKGVNKIDSLVCFSMGGSFIPAWLTQEDIKVDKLYPLYSGYSIPDFAREYWQIQLDILALDQEQKPNFQQISERLLENFKVSSEENLIFLGVVSAIANDILKLEESFSSDTRDDFLINALKICRKISFLRFQTEERFDDTSVEYLSKQSEAFVAGGMKPRNYQALVENITKLENSPLAARQFPQVFAISNSRDMLYLSAKASLPGLEIEKSLVEELREGHDAFLIGNSGFLKNFHQL